VKKKGSCLGIAVREEDLARLPEALKAYRSISYHCYARRVDCRRQDIKLTALDFAAALAIMSLAKIHAKEDGSLPQKYCKRIWQKAYEQGLLPRQFNDSRWAVIWRTGADCGYLDVIDATYWHKGCAIHSQHPASCKEFNCWWRAGMVPGLKCPDLSGIIVDSSMRPNDRAVVRVWEHKPGALQWAWNRKRANTGW
jgi:hypothetical protein